MWDAQMRLETAAHTTMQKMPVHPNRPWDARTSQHPSDALKKCWIEETVHPNITICSEFTWVYVNVGEIVSSLEQIWRFALAFARH